MGTDERQVAVVLCRPLGWEAEATYRTYARWADLMAHAGFPVLRFDYAGTGDSPGSDDEPGRLAAWVGSVHAAVEGAKRLSGRERVALAGMHLGATLAVLAGSERDDVETLVVWGAVPNGAAYVRQMRAYRLLNALPQDPRGGGQPGDEEAAGYRVLAATVAELRHIHLGRLNRAPARTVLIAGTDAGGSERSLAEAWAALGARITVCDARGWQEMMQEPRRSVVPERLLADVVDFLVCAHPDRAPRPSVEPSHPQSWPRSWSTSSGVVEELVCLGNGGVMSGVLSRGPATASAELPTVLLLTTASHHRIGPNRLWVRLARALSEQGARTLRFDLLGVGDSLVEPGISATHAYSRDAVLEVRAAMDALEQSTGANRFLLVGLCSGAYLSYHCGVDDPRVVGMVLVNPQTFRWHEGDSLELKRRQSIRSVRYYRKAVLKGHTWRRAVRGELHLASLAHVLLARTWAGLRARVLRSSSQSEVARALRTLVARGTDVHFIFGADDEGVDMLTRESGSALTELSKEAGFLLEVFEGPAHTFEQIWSQELLTRSIVERTVARFAASPARSATG